MERYFKPDERTDSRILSCETLLSKSICGTRATREQRSRNHSRFDSEAGLPYRSDRSGDFGAQLPIGHASEPRTCSHGRSRSGTRGPQYLTHGSQSDYQIKVGRADARADRVDTGAEIRPARVISCALSLPAFFTFFLCCLFLIVVPKTRRSS